MTDTKNVPRGTAAPAPDAMATRRLQTAPLDVFLDRLTLPAATKLCDERPELGGQLIMALIAHNTAALPNTAFVKRQDGTILKKQRARIRLSQREGHLLPITKRIRENGKKTYITTFDLSINGLRRLNELPALQIIRPECVVVNGMSQMNPYIQVDPVSKMPEVVYARCLCVGYSPMGSLVATDAMVRLDIGIYLLENWQAKMDQLEGGASRLGVYGSADEPPVDDAGKKSPGRWRFMPIHSVGGIGLWINLAAPEAGTILSDHTTRVKFIERLAQSFAERNALKSHPSMPKSINAENGVASVEVTGWTTDFNRADLERLRECIEKNRIEDFVDADGKSIDTIAVVVDDVDEGDRASIEDEFKTEKTSERGEDEEQQDDETTEATIEQTAEVVDLLPQATELFGKLCDLRGKAFAVKTLKDTGAEVLEEANNDQLGDFVEKARAVIEAKP